MATILKGQVVQITGTTGGDSKPLVSAWAPSAYEEPSISTGYKVLGVAMTDALEGEPIVALKRGYLRDMSDGAEAWAVGDIIYASSTGSLTKTRPAAPLPQVIVGTVFEANGSNWDMAVDVRELPNIGELTGVTRESPVNLDALLYNGTTHCWVPRQIDHGGDIAGLLDDDHTQYLKERLSGGAESEVPGHSHQAVASAGQLDHGLANTAASLVDDDHPLYQRKHGFEVASDGSALVTITYDKTTRKITVTPVGATFRFWIDGVQYIKSGAQLSGAHTTALGKHFFYYDSAGALQVSTTPWSIRDRTAASVALVYWESTASDGWCFYECHTADRTLEQHYHDHFSEGTKYITGGALSGYALTTDTDAAVSFAIAAATIADEDIVRVLTAVADGGPYMTLWRSGAAGDWTFNDTRTSPYEIVAPYIAYNNQNAGGAGVWGLSSVGAGNFVPYFLCATTGVQSARQFFMVPAQAVTGTLASALAYTTANIDWGTVPFEEFVPLYRIIFRTGASYASTGRARIEQIDSVSTSSTATLPGTPTLHNALGGRDAINTHPASSITFTPYSTLASTDVQSAIQELLDESGGGGATVLDDLTDVNAPAPANGDVLAWNDGAGEWQPASASAPGAHESTHEAGQADELPIENMGTASTDVTTVLKPDGAGGVEWEQPHVEDLYTPETDTAKVLMPGGSNDAAWSLFEVLNAITAETDVSKVLKPDGTGGVEWGTAAAGSGLWSPDTPPVSPNTEDDEFNGVSLDAKWTTAHTGSPTVAYNTPASRLKITCATTTTYLIKQDYAAAAAFSLTMKIEAMLNANTHSVGMEIWDSGETNSVRIFLLFASGTSAAPVLFADRKDSGSYTGSVLPLWGWLSPVYLRIVRDGSNGWQYEASHDGLSFRPVLALSKTFTVHHFGLYGNWPQGGASVTTYIDWIRRDWEPV